MRRQEFEVKISFELLPFYFRLFFTLLSDFLYIGLVRRESRLEAQA